MSTAESRPAVPTAPEGWTPNAGPDPVLRAKHGLIGAQVSRLDGPLKVRGEARFAAEYPMEGMVYAALRYSTIARGRITTLDASAAASAAGVVLVMTHRNAPRMQPPPLFPTAPKAAGGSDLPVMQDNSVHWNGEPVAVVLAETQEQADHAASLIKVAYESSTPRTFEEARAHPRTPDSLVGQPVQVLVGDAEAARGPTMCSGLPRRSSPGAPCGSRSLARASTGWSAVARTPSSESQLAPMRTAASPRSCTPASPR